MPILGRSNWFQLYNQGHADHQLAVNRSKMDAGELHLWHNVEVLLQVIEEAGLQEKLEEKYQHAIDNYAQIENERYAKYRSQIEESQQLTMDMNRNVIEYLAGKKPES